MEQEQAGREDMIIRVERSGGFTGIPLRAVIDTRTLDPDEYRALQRLLDTTDFFSLPEIIQTKSGGADRFQYKLTVEEETRAHTVEVSDASAPVELQEFIQHVSLIARRMRH
jgi:hypothetical protein